MNRFPFDTLNKKPKLWDLAILGALVVGAIALLFALDAERNTLAIAIILDVFFPILIARLMLAFFRQLRYNPYSYNTIIYVGFSLFFLSAWILQVVLTVRMLREPALYQLPTVLMTVLNSAKNYMQLSVPFILVFSVLLCISNLSLIRHEGLRGVNILGIVLSVLMLASEAFLFFVDFYASGSQVEVMIHDIFVNTFAAIYLYFECMLIGTIVANIIVVRYEPDPDKDFIIILGCGIRKDGTPSPLLRGRIDRAFRFAETQKAQTGKEPIFIVSGGQGKDEVVPESTAMKRYLLELGVPEERIVEEDQSHDTLENMRFSKEKIQAIDPNGTVAFVTTNYHVFRGGLCARRVKMRALGMGAKTKWYFWPNASVREFVGLLTEHRGKQALIFGGMLLFYIALTVFCYQI